MPFTVPSADEALAPLVQSQVFETDLSILVSALSGTGVVSGCAVTAQGSPDMTVAVAAGTILAAGVAVAVTGGNLTVGAADATNPRVDLISASAAGVKTITAGVAAAVASVKPADLPAGHIGLAFVYVAPTDTAINTNEITDKRVIINGGYVTADSTADVTLTADTIADATGVSIAVPSLVGVWALMAQGTFSATTATFDYCLGQITTAANVVVAESRGNVNSNSPVCYGCFAIVAPGADTTYKYRGQSGRTGNKILRYGQGTNIGTRLVAFRIA